MAKRNVVRVKPVSFETDWRADMKAVGVKVPKTVPETRHTPVNHDPTPYSLAVDLTARRVVRRIVGVMPNALYTGPFYSWEDFCALIEQSRTGRDAGEESWSSADDVTKKGGER